MSAVYDLIGIGIGPFNLGLAAIARSVPELRARFFERRTEFRWHGDMMIEGATLQVSYLADLVTLVDPTSPFTFLAYLKHVGRLYQFAIRDSSYISRREYDGYCRWICQRLGELEFGADVTRVEREPGGDFVVEVRRADGAVERVRARHVVVGVGTTPSVPAGVPLAGDGGGLVFHSAEYLRHRERALATRAIAVVGSGQSAAEIFLDLLERKPDRTRLTWLTRSPRFFPMDYSKLAVEMAAPDYIDHFYRLPAAARERVLAGQDSLYKGINLALIDRIYDALYDRTLDGPRDDVHLAASCELEAVARPRGGPVRLGFVQRELERRFELEADALVLATGYAYRIPSCLDPLRDRLVLDAAGRPVIGRGYRLAGDLDRVFVQNAELHTHGFTAPDLSLGPYRNATILNAILGEERFRLERRIAFQDFGVPPHARPLDDDRVGRPTWGEPRPGERSGGRAGDRVGGR